MGLPLQNGTDGYHSYTFYQGVLAGQLVCTLALFVSLQAFHYWVWGYDQQEYQFKKNEEGDAAVQPPPESQWRWDQKSFNLYFSIIFGTHASASILPLAYYPSILTCVVGYIHLGCFCGMLINTICVNEKQPGKGGRTTTNRIFWILMCILNLIQILAGLTGIPTVLK